LTSFFKRFSEKPLKGKLIAKTLVYIVSRKRPSTGGEVELSVVVPVFNEEDSIGSLLDRMINVLRDTVANCEVIVVDDGSTDRTPEVVEEKGKAWHIKIIRHRFNKGYGEALKTGLRASRGRCVLIMDGDGSYDPSQIPRLYSAIRANDYDMVIGWRTYVAGAEEPYRTVAKKFLNLLASLLFKERVKDVNSGMRVFKREAILSILDELPSKFSFTTTATLLFLKKKLKIAYTPISYHRRKGKSKMKFVRDGLKILLTILCIAFFGKGLRLSS